MKTPIHNFLFAIFFTVSSIQSQQGTIDPPGQMVNIGGYELHIHEQGNSEITLVIEPGAGSWSVHWLDLQEKLASKFRVITYDRAGYGWSDPSPYSRTALNIVHELNAGLEKSGIKGPLILIGHSYGGMLMRAFTRNYPDKVQALILVDSASEYQFDHLPPMISMILESGKQRFKQTGQAIRLGALNSAMIPVDSTLQNRYWKAYQNSAARACYYDAMYNEMDLLPLTYQQTEIKTPLDIPLLVITAGDSFTAFKQIPGVPISESNQKWAGLQKKLLQISTQSEQYVIPNATHDLLLSAPEALEKAIVRFVKEMSE